MTRRLLHCAAVVAMAMTSGCISPLELNRLKGDREFIHYWPPPAGEKRLRLAVKDCMDMKGVVTSAGSEYFYERASPAVKDAACLKAARERDVVIVGKTNLTELGLGVSGLNDYFGTPRNPLAGEKRLMPGGSSSGSAVAVANGKADVAFGTDTAGSIRTPAACCGVYGLKATFKSIPGEGITTMSPENLGSIGPLARNIPHLVEGMDLLKPGFAAEYRRAVAARPSARGIRVGRLYVNGTDSAIDQAVDEALRKAGFKVIRLSTQYTEAWEKASKQGQVIAVADAYTSFHPLLTKGGVTLTTKAGLLLGKLRDDDKTYGEALRYRTEWRRLLDQAFARVDLIALPTLKHLPLTIPPWGRTAPFEARALAMQNTVPVNYAGNPALAMPIPLRDHELPVTSLQLIGPNHSEARILNAGRIVAGEQAIHQ